MEDIVILEPQYKISDKEFDCLRGLVKDHAGISLSDHKKMLVVSRLSKRLRELDLRTFGDYYDMLTQDIGSVNEELTRFINEITTNKTDFYRESHQFEFLVRNILPEILSSSAFDCRKELRVWSAGCSSGEEPYTLAITFNEFFKETLGWRIKILATDIDTNILEKAKQGIYDEQTVKPIPYEYLSRYFKKGIGINGGQYKAKQNLKSMVKFAKHNMVYDQLSLSEPVDIIFCRNVLIYFDNATTEKVIFSHLYNALKPGGHLFLGHSESLPVGNKRFKRVANSVYVKHEQERVGQVDR